MEKILKNDVSAVLYPVTVKGVIANLTARTFDDVETVYLMPKGKADLMDKNARAAFVKDNAGAQPTAVTVGTPRLYTMTAAAFVAAAVVSDVPANRI